MIRRRLLAAVLAVALAFGAISTSSAPLTRVLPSPPPCRFIPALSTDSATDVGDHVDHPVRAQIDHDRPVAAPAQYEVVHLGALWGPTRPGVSSARPRWQ